MAKKKKHRKHTPWTSEVQTSAGNIALGAKLGDIPVSELKGPARQMYEEMTLEELQSHSKEAKGKKLPKRVKKRKRR